MAPSLDTIPLEVLERIALFVVSEELNGPPKDLLSLCLTCKVVHDSLSFSCNPSLYASLFQCKFDIAAPRRRLGSDHITAQTLAGELRTRFEAMQRIRRGIGSHEWLSQDRRFDLWTAIFMMLENDGLNAIQLRKFGKVQDWLYTYFLEETGGSRIQPDMLANHWPSNNTDNNLALWLLYLLDAEGTSPPCKLFAEILRIYAIGANRYPLTYPAHRWSDYSLHQTIPLGAVYCHFNLNLFPSPPATAVTAVSGYMARLRQPTAIMWALPQEVLSELPQPSPCGEASGLRSSNGSSSQQWDCVWERCIGPSLCTDYIDPANGLPRYYRPGSLDGSWEGLFTYAEFGVYAAMLSGDSSPQNISETTIGHNLQVWKVREYNLYSSTSSTGLSGDAVLPAGSVLGAFFPVPTYIQEDDHHAVFIHDSQKTIYHRPRQATDADGANQPDRGILRDVIIIGEGHSAWGDFKLRGRIRPSDAFVTILKEYNGPTDRGRWLYRGYIFGGKFVGRWRDVLTPVHMSGYEGGFALTHRESLRGF